MDHRVEPEEEQHWRVHMLQIGSTAEVCSEVWKGPGRCWAHNAWRKWCVWHV